MKTFTLNDGNLLPAFGLGTWKSQPGEVNDAVKEALRIGYTHIDCAWIYLNEDEVGSGLQAALAEALIQREDLFVTSKLWNTFHDPADVEQGCRQTLTALGLEYLDLYLMHWPVAFRDDGNLMPEDESGFIPLSELPLSKTFAAMATLKEKGLVKSIGVSNFSVSKLEKLIAECGIVPAVNQVELHPYNPQPELMAYCADKGIVLTAYSPLGSADRPDSMKGADEPPLLNNQVVLATAEQEGLTPGQLLIAWALTRGTSVIPKSVNAGRIAENLAAADHELSIAARQVLDEIELRYRYVSPSGWFIPGVTYEGQDFWA